MALAPVRAAQSEDAEAMAAIYNGYVRDTSVTFTDVEATPEQLIDAMAGGQTHWVAMLDTRVVGFARLSPFRAGPGYARTAEHSIYAAPWAQGRGVGTALLAAAETGARAQGVHVLVAGISGENTAAQRFHARRGYAPAGALREVGWKLGRWQDLVLMQKVLSARAGND